MGYRAKRVVALVVVIVPLLPACGSNGSETSGAAGQVGAASAGGTMAGSGGATAGMAGSSGAGGAASLLPQGAVSIAVMKIPGCTPDAGVIDAPVVSSGHPVSDTSPGTERELNGVDNRYVKCKVAVDASGVFAADGSIELNDSTHVELNFVTNMLAADGKSYVGGAGVRGNYFGWHGSTGDSPCTFSTMLLEPGKMWGSVTCNKVVSEGGSDICSVAASYFAFENCDTKL